MTGRMSDNPADSLRREPKVVAATLAEQLDREAKEFADSELPNSQYARWLMARVTALEAALESARADERERLQRENQEAVKLLKYALHLRMYGENAPGGNETWREFDGNCERFLRARLDAGGGV